MIEIALARDDGVDADAIAAIDRTCFVQPTVNIAAELERSWARVWVARSPGPSREARAFLLAWLVADELHILSVATLPGFRRKGFARALLQHAMTFARERHVRVVLLEVRRSNHAAMRLYRQLGFWAAGVRPSYYADNLEDAVEMMLELDPVTGSIVPQKDRVVV